MVLGNPKPSNARLSTRARPSGPMARYQPGILGNPVACNHCGQTAHDHIAGACPPEAIEFLGLA